MKKNASSLPATMVHATVGPISQASAEQKSNRSHSIHVKFKNTGKTSPWCRKIGYHCGLSNKMERRISGSGDTLSLDLGGGHTDGFSAWNCIHLCYRHFPHVDYSSFLRGEKTNNISSLKSSSIWGFFNLKLQNQIKHPYQ